MNRQKTWSVPSILMLLVTVVVLAASLVFLISVMR